MANKKISDYTEALSVANDDFFEISVDAGGGSFLTRKVKKSNMGVSSPLTTKGDVYTFDSADTRLPVGADGQALIADSAEATGLKWGTVSADNMATADLTLTAARTHDLAGFELKFDNGQVTIEGQNTSPSQTAILIQNSIGSQFFKVDNAGGFALGSGATYTDENNVSIGRTANGIGSNAVSIGYLSDATGTSTTALGYLSQATGTTATAIGAAANASASSSTAIGTSSTASVSGSTSLGNTASAAGSNSTSIGFQSNVTGISSLAVGYISQATGTVSTSLGAGCIASNNNTIAIGATMTASAANAYIIGSSNSAKTNSTANSFEVNFNETTSSIRLSNSADSFINTTGGFVVGSGTVNASAKFQIDSTTEGFLPPRMTTTEKNAITTPATGLVVYDSTLNKLAVYTGAAWETVTSA